MSKNVNKFDKSNINKDTNKIYIFLKDPRKKKNSINWKSL